MTLTRTFAINQRGRDFVMGDVHGCFTLAQQLLDQVGFDPARDRLFSVGDLIDRGFENEAALDWLEASWFFPVRGNHDQFLLDYGECTYPDNLEWVANGGAWWLAVDRLTRLRFLDLVGCLPYLIEVETEAGLVGIVHADVPRNLRWDTLKQLINEGYPQVQQAVLWMRTRASGRALGPVEGVFRVVCGHTPQEQAKQVDNVWFIDTGAGYNPEHRPWAGLTLLNLHTWETHFAPVKEKREAF